MPIRHEIREGLLRVVVDGDYDDAALRAARQAAFEDPAFESGMLALIDSRKTLANPPRAKLVEIASYLTSLRAHIGPRCALVVGDALHFGLGRMLGAFVETEQLEIQVFEDPAAAEAWLRGRSQR